MKKKLIVFLAVVLCVTVAFTLVACGDKNKKGDENKGDGSGDNVSATAYEGGGTVLAAVALTAADLEDPENEKYFLSGTSQVINGATATDVTNYRNKLVKGGWTLVDSGAIAAASSNEYYIYYKGDTVISVIYAGTTLTIATVNYKAGTVAKMLQQNDDDDDDDDDDVPLGTKNDSWPSSQILAKIGTALPVWTEATEYYYLETTTPAITATVTFKGTANDVSIYQTRLTNAEFGFEFVSPGAYSKTVGSKTIGVGIVEAGGYVSVSATVVTVGGQALALSDVQSRIAEIYSGFTFSEASSITVSGEYVELANDAFRIMLTSSDLDALMTSIESDFDDVVSEFGYTKAGATTVSYSKNETSYIEIREDEDGIEISLLVLPEARSSWPTAAIAEYVGAGNLPAYVAEGENAEYSAWTGHPDAGYGITVSGTTQIEYDTYVSSLTSAGYAYDSENDKYSKAFADNLVVVEVTYEDATGQTVFFVRIISLSGDLDAWPTASLANDLADFTLPAVSGATSFSYDADLWIGGSGFITLEAFGVSEAELDTYLTTTLSAADRVDANTLRLLSDDTQLVIEYSYDEIISCLTMELSIDSYVAPKYTQIPANLKMEYVTDTQYEAYTLYRVGNDWCYAVTNNPDTDNATTDYYYWKYDAATSQWTRYEYDSVGDVAWTPNLEEVVTTANIDDMLGDYWGKLLMTADAKFLAGTHGEATIAGIPCNTYTYADEDSWTYFIAIAKEGGLCMKYTEEFMGTTPEKFEVTEIVTSGVTMPADEFPVALDAEVAWPTAKMNKDVGASIVPAYTGDATMINYNDSLSKYGKIVITIKGVTLADFNTYIALYTEAGYTLESSEEESYTFEKTSGGNTYTVNIAYSDYYEELTIEVIQPIEY